MPDLIAACGEAGLDLRGMAVDIRRLNTDRNNRAHDDPLRHIDHDQAAHAVETARVLQRRIRATVQGKQDARSLPHMAVQAVQVVRAATSGQLRAGVASTPARLSTSRAGAALSPTAPSAPAAATATSTSDEAPAASASFAPAVVAEHLSDSSAGEPPVDAASPSPVEALDGSGDSSDGDDSSAELPAISRRRRRSRRGVRVLLRVLVAAALLLVGLAAGIGISIPVTTGHAPAWLSFATRLLPTPATTATTIATATASPAPAITTQPQVAGSLVVGVPICTGGSASFTLANTGGKPARWSVGSPDAESAVFAGGPGAPGAPTLAGTLTPGATVTLYVANPGASASSPGAVYHVIVVATSGTAQLVAPAC
jgi:hypothetical protein